MTDYTDLIERLRDDDHALSQRDRYKSAAAIAALQADIAALHKRQHEVECLATERLRENAALQAERDALREAGKALCDAVEADDGSEHHYFTISGIAKAMRAALTSPPQTAV